MGPTKKASKTLRKLAGLAYERELTRALEALAKQFVRWQEGGITCWNLSERIHEFHDGESRDLFKRYNYVEPEITVARAVAASILAESEIPQESLDRMRQSIEYFREELSADQ